MWVFVGVVMALQSSIRDATAEAGRTSDAAPPALAPVRPRPWIGGWLLFDVTRQRLPELDRALGQHGFARFDTNAPSYGFALGAHVWRALRVEYDMTYGQRWASHRSLPSHAILSCVRFAPRLGVVAYEHDGLSVLGLVGVRGERRILAFAAKAVSRPEEEYFALLRFGLTGEVGLGVEYYLPLTRRKGLLVGTRAGYARGLVESRFIAESPMGPASTLSGGAFTAFYFGFSEFAPF